MSVPERRFPDDDGSRKGPGDVPLSYDRVKSVYVCVCVCVYERKNEYKETIRKLTVKELADKYQALASNTNGMGKF